jgi:teichuronic acid biosynthesis glycosyltransferase TuaG
MKPDAITVVVPAYHSESTIEDALRSVGEQSLRAREVIVVDDDSPDGTVSTARSMQGKIDVPIRIIEQDRNRGPAAARNAGVLAAETEWIAFLDADDAWLPNRLSVQCDVVKRYPDVSMLCAETMAWNADRADPAQGAGGGSEEQLALRDFAFGNPVATSTVLIRKQIVEEAGGFDVQFRGPEDYDLWMRVAKNGRIMKTRSPLSRYRCVPGSLSLDDRTFLPQVLRVLDKAFGPDGAMGNLQNLRMTAESTQYWNASWMAFSRGARVVALQHWLRAYLMNGRGGEPVRRKWWPLLCRYLVGRPEGGGGGA